jgi:hypothetical protein
VEKSGLMLRSVVQARGYSLLHSIQLGPGSHLASISFGNKRCSLEQTAVEAGNAPPTPFSTELTNAWTCIPPSLYKLNVHNNNFSFRNSL